MELNLAYMEHHNFESISEDDVTYKYEYKRAEKRLKDIKGFYRHLFAYILFTPFTIFINYKTYWDYKWFWYSIISWGIALAIHGFVVFVHRGKGVFSKKWEQRKIEQFMKEEENEKKWS